MWLYILLDILVARLWLYMTGYPSSLCVLVHTAGYPSSLCVVVHMTGYPSNSCVVVHDWIT